MSRWRCAILLLLSQVSGLLGLLLLLLLRRLEACRLRLLEALVLLLVLRRVACGLGLKRTRGIASVLLLERLLLGEASWLLRLEGRRLALEASWLGL